MKRYSSVSGYSDAAVDEELETSSGEPGGYKASFLDRILDFFYFYDYYIAIVIVSGLLVWFALKG